MTNDSSRRRAAIVDIGSNSVRLVVYEGPARVPNSLYNEKVLAGLGRIDKYNQLDPAACERTLRAVRRFYRLIDEMQVTDVQTVATAAVRDASNGDDLLGQIRAIGLEPRILSGAEEARTAALGVISAMPDADGIVGDLGGGSLELARVRHGEVHELASFPLGVLRLTALRERSPQLVGKTIDDAVTAAGWGGKGRKLPFYLVGGSWRSLAKVHMYMSGYPLPIVHAYEFPADSVPWLAARLKTAERQELRHIASISSARLAMMGEATSMLAHLMRVLKSDRVVASAFGLREGLLFASLNPAIQAQDPLIAQVREEAFRQGRQAEHGVVINRWIAPVARAHDEALANDPALARLRLAACTLVDVSWRAHPDFRPERAVEIALHGNLVGIDGPGRAFVAAILHSAMGGHPKRIDPVIAALSPAKWLAHAHVIGLAMRLAQRWSGGAAGPLERSNLEFAEDGRLILRCQPEDDVLYGESVQKLHESLAAELQSGGGAAAAA